MMDLLRSSTAVLGLVGYAVPMCFGGFINLIPGNWCCNVRNHFVRKVHTIILTTKMWTVENRELLLWW
ncbi:hypothetical protein AOLI_G00124210 [Acnodon oligacanthus]